MALGDLSRSHCPLCLDKGQISYLKLFQINMDEAFYSCENAECLYPVGETGDINSLLMQRRCLDMPDGNKSAPDKARDLAATGNIEEETLIDEISRLVDNGFNTDSLGPDFECDFEDILEFIGDASVPSTDPGQKSNGHNSQSVQSNGTVG